MIEDDPTDLQLITKHMKLPFTTSDNYTVLTASTYEEAETMLRDYAGEIAVVILDAYLSPGAHPSGPGFETEPLIELVTSSEVIFVGNTSDPTAASRMEAVHGFEYIADPKTIGLADLPWDEILPDL